MAAALCSLITLFSYDIETRNVLCAEGMFELMESLLGLATLACDDHSSRTLLPLGIALLHTVHHLLL